MTNFGATEIYYYYCSVYRGSDREEGAETPQNNIF